MIAWLSGRLQSRTAEAVIIDVAGVGYQVSVPRSTADALPGPGAGVSLHIHTLLREDSLNLYGFSSELEKDLFLLLLGVSGVGPKLALAVLSGHAAPDLVAIIRSGDDARLCAIPGIGKKTAARLCLELRDKVRHIAAGPSLAAPAGAPGAARREDAVSALVNLGYRRQQAEEAVQRISEQHPGIPVAELIREALAALAQR